MESSNEIIVPSTSKISKKSKKQDKSKCDVPSARHPMKSTRWARHIYLIIKEFVPHLLQREDVCIAYQSFVECLKGYNSNLYTFLPHKRRKYTQGIVLEKMTFDNYFDRTIPAIFHDENMVWRNPHLKDLHKRIVDDIKSHYKPLYDLIKEELLPKMELKQKEERAKQMIPLLRKDIDKLELEIEGENKRYKLFLENEQHRHQQILKHLEKEIHHKIQELQQFVSPISTHLNSPPSDSPPSPTDSPPSDSESDT